jgi:hypothetical protein
MHEFVGLGHSMTHAVAGSCPDETRTSEHIGISPAEEGWTVAKDDEMYPVAALTCNVLQHNNVQELGKESWETEQDTYYVGNRPWLQAYPTSNEFVPQLENPEVDPQTQGNQQAGRQRQCKEEGEEREEEEEEN